MDRDKLLMLGGAAVVAIVAYSSVVGTSTSSRSGSGSSSGTGSSTSSSGAKLPTDEGAEVTNNIQETVGIGFTHPDDAHDVSRVMRVRERVTGLFPQGESIPIAQTKSEAIAHSNVTGELTVY